MVKIFQLTVDSDQSWTGDPLLGNIASHATVVGGVSQLGLQDQQVAGAADDEVGVLLGVQLHPVPQPAQDLGLRFAPGRVTDQLTLLAHLQLLRVGRRLEISSQI